MERNSKVVFVMLVLVLVGFVQAQESEEKLNVVIYIADDLGRNDIGPYGNQVVETPYLDQFAKQAMVFNQAFASSPTCAPSRASIHTGLMPFKHGAHANHTGISTDVKTLPSYLKDQGYAVALAGKLHLGPMEQYPFDLIKGTNVPEPGHENDGVLWTDLELDPVDNWLAEASSKKQPFVLVVNDHSPHVIWPEEASYDPKEVDIPSFHIDTEETRKSRARYYTDITKMDNNLGELLKSIKANGLEENTIIIFTADQGPQWAFGKWNLYDYGMQVPLIVHWPGKTNKRIENEELISLTDILPTLMEMAHTKVSNSIDGKSFMGLLTGEKTTHRESVFGSHTGDGTMNRSPMRMIRTKRYKYILNLAPQQVYHTHMDKAKDHDGGREYWDSWVKKSFSDSPEAASVLWRYHHRPPEELYDIKNDPHERNNLAANPHYQAIIKDFRAQLKTWREDQGDTETGPYKPKKRKNNKRKKPIAPYIFK